MPKEIVKSGKHGYSSSDLPEAVGAQIRKQREKLGLSVRGLARTVGVSASLISQVEHGKASPSVGTLYAIVSELGLSLDELFFSSAGGPRGRTATASQTLGDVDDLIGAGWEAPSEGPVLRQQSRLKLTLETGVRWERLTASHDPTVDFLYVTYPVGAESCPPDKLVEHQGSESGVVLNGRLGATVGSDSYELEPGDSIAFESTTPHRLWAVGDSPATAIWVVLGREGDPRLG